MAIDPSDEQREAYQKRYSHLLAVLQKKSGQWMTRQDIADALGLVTLTSQLHGLERLKSVGLIEARTYMNHWEYRIKP